MGRLVALLPLAVLVFLSVYFAFGLSRDPQQLPSALINQPVPTFDLPAIENRSKGFKNDDLKGKVTLINIFGSWCVSCRVEHPFLMALKEENVIPIYGIDWREENRKDGPAWLKKFGDPYTLIGDDPKSKGAIAFGVTGAPESFILDKLGIIRYKHVGPISAQNWEDTLWPIIKELQAQ